jgi:hypothetical protein
VGLFEHLREQWVESMRIVQLLVLTALPIGVCFAQTKLPKSKREDESAQKGTKLHPEQERAYTQAYKTGAVPKP